MKYADFYDCDVCNGISNGMSLFVSGCPFHCKGCFNPEAWDYNYGKEWTPQIEDKFLKLVGRDYIKRISFLGGSPLCDKNIENVLLLVQRIRNEYPDKQIWIYTGFTWEEISNPASLDDGWFTIQQQYRKEILNYIDVLVDGRFEEDKKDASLAFRGSSNQRIIDVQKSLKTEEVILWEEPS